MKYGKQSIGALAQWQECQDSRHTKIYISKKIPA